RRAYLPAGGVARRDCAIYILLLIPRIGKLMGNAPLDVALQPERSLWTSLSARLQELTRLAEPAACPTPPRSFSPWRPSPLAPWQGSRRASLWPRLTASAPLL